MLGALWVDREWVDDGEISLELVQWGLNFLDLSKLGSFAALLHGQVTEVQISR